MYLTTGDILLVDTEGFIASKVDEFQGNDYNHTGFIVSMYGDLYVFEAIDSGMAFTPFLDYRQRVEKEDMRLLILRPKVPVWDSVNKPSLMRFILPLTRQKYEFKS